MFGDAASQPGSTGVVISPLRGLTAKHVALNTGGADCWAARAVVCLCRVHWWLLGVTSPPRRRRRRLGSLEWAAVGTSAPRTSETLQTPRPVRGQTTRLVQRRSLMQNY